MPNVKVKVKKSMEEGPQVGVPLAADTGWDVGGEAGLADGTRQPGAALRQHCHEVHLAWLVARADVEAVGDHGVEALDPSSFLRQSPLLRIAPFDGEYTEIGRRTDGGEVVAEGRRSVPACEGSQVLGHALPERIARLAHVKEATAHTGQYVEAAVRRTGQTMEDGKDARTGC